jgi:hypothetical protein
MREQGVLRARRVPVVADEPLIGRDRFDPYLLEHAALGPPQGSRTGSRQRTQELHG